MRMRERIIASVVGIEGGYTDDALDSGGKTKWGITKKTARAMGYNGKMRNLPRDIAIDIYVRRYWDVIRGDALLKTGGYTLAYEVFEQSVNMGVVRAGRNLQRVLNVLNSNEKYYADLRVDGQIGTKTIDALKQYREKRGMRGIGVLVTYLNAIQGAFYIELAEHREKDERFVYGWGANRVFAAAV